MTFLFGNINIVTQYIMIFKNWENKFSSRQMWIARLKFITAQLYKYQTYINSYFIFMLYPTTE